MHANFHKYSVLLVSIFMMLFGCDKSEDDVLIKGEIANLETPYIITTHLHAGSLVVDSIYPKNGKFSYKTPIDTFTVFTFYFNDYASSTVFFADKKDKIELRGDAALPDLIEVQGGKINEDLSKFKKENEKLLQERAELVQKIEDEENKHIDNGFAGKNEQISKINGLNHELTLNAENFIKENPDKIASVILMNDFLKNSENPGALDRSLNYLEGDAKNFPLTKTLEKFNSRLQKSVEGAQLPPFTMIDNKNDSIKSKDFDGKFLVLSFLSNSDTESRENVRQLKSIYKEISKKEVKFVSVYIDAYNYPVKSAKEDSIKWTIVSEKEGWASKIVDLYNVEYVPYNILISSKGKILRRDIPAQEIESAIASEKEKLKDKDKEE